MKLQYAYIKRILTSKVFYLSILCVVFVMCSGINFRNLPYGVLAQLESTLDLGSYRKMILLFSSMPFVSFYAAESGTNMDRQIISRSSLKSYLNSHICLCFLTAFFVSFLGMFLSALILSVKYPLYVEGSYVIYGLTEQHPIQQLSQSSDTFMAFFLLKGIIYSFSMGIWALSGIAISAIINNTFVATVSPLVFSYVLEFFTIDSKIFPDLWHLSLCYTVVSENLWISIGYIVGVFFVVGLLFSIVFRIFVTRRVHNEIH